jgi:hypothetical protein
LAWIFYILLNYFEKTISFFDIKNTEVIGLDSKNATLGKSPITVNIVVDVDDEDLDQ